MTTTPPFTLKNPTAQVTIHPAEGGVATDLAVDGLSVLARTPWSDTVDAAPSPASDEQEWVRRWRGGWQLCFPTAGQPDPDAHPRQSFHGTASQASWTVDERTPTSAGLTWQDALGLRARRVWQLLDDGLRVTTTARNDGDHDRTLIVAEHLVLGADLLAPIFGGEPSRIDLPSPTSMVDLDYDGRPSGGGSPWPGDPTVQWEVVSTATPARVVALTPPRDSAVTLSAAGHRAIVTWEGLPHLLLWEELAQSQEEPWNGQVVAVGIEPTSTPHGAGTAVGGGFDLQPGTEFTWTTTLRVVRATEDQEKTP